MRQLIAAVLTLCAWAVMSMPNLAAAAPVPGGSNQRDSIEGCMNEWLFDGIWRLKVDAVNPLSDPSMAGFFGWGVTVEMRNATAKPDYTLSYTGEQNLTLGFADDTTLDISATADGTRDSQKLTSHTFAQATAFKHTLTFWYPSGTKQSEVQKPTKFLLVIDPKIQDYHAGTFHQPNYTTKHPSFRVKLDCSK